MTLTPKMALIPPWAVDVRPEVEQPPEIKVLLSVKVGDDVLDMNVLCLTTCVSSNASPEAMKLLKSAQDLLTAKLEFEAALKEVQATFKE